MSIGWKLGTAVALALSAFLLLAIFVLLGQRNEARKDRDAALVRAEVLTANVSTLERALETQGRSIAEAEKTAQNERDLGSARLAAVQAQNKALIADVGKIRSLLSGASVPQSCAEGINALRASRR